MSVPNRIKNPNKTKHCEEHLETLFLTITETMKPSSLDLNKGTIFKNGSIKEASKDANSFVLHVTDVEIRFFGEVMEGCKNNLRRFKVDKGNVLTKKTIFFVSLRLYVSI